MHFVINAMQKNSCNSSQKNRESVLLEEKEEAENSQFDSAFKRTVSQRGYCALQKRNRPPSFYIKYVRDPFTTLIDCRWRTLIIIYTLSFLISFSLFAVCWWFIAYMHGDIIDSPYKTNGSVPCVTQMDNMIKSFLFSVETQVTIGYGNRTPTTECPEAIFLLSAQSIFGLLLQSIIVGVVFAKLSRPKSRGESILFSKKAVISNRDGFPYFMFRIGDERKSHVTGCKLRGWVIKTQATEEGVFLPNYVTKINISVDDGGKHFFLLWPMIATHKIDSTSPLYGIQPEQMTKAKMEVIISLVCTSEATGQEIEIRRSYTAQDILWGHRFKSIIQMDSPDFIVDYAHFNSTFKVESSYKLKDSSPVAHSSNN